MRRFLFVISAAAACGMVACERKPASDSADENKRQEQREADDRRIAELRDLEQRAADREVAAVASELEKQRQDLAAERAKLERDRDALSEEQKRAADARLERIREQEEENERRAELRRAEQRKRDQRLAEERAASGRAEQNLDFFYDALDPEGDWIEVERFGYCWQPNAARRGDWRPYVDGHWAYTNYGWTWVSEEPFGWATYHYGRWIRLRRQGWVWVPGSEWAPAWVSWRRSDRHIGWAPLPPEAHSTSGFTAAVESRYDIGPGSYNFVAIENFGQPTYVKEVLQPEQNISIVQQTVNVTNITYQNIDNRLVVRNEGPQFSEISKRANLRRLTVERVAQGPRSAEVRGDTLRLVAPSVAPSAKESRPPKRVRENVKAPDVERGWTGASATAVSQVREQQKQEARNVEQTRPFPRPMVPAQKAETPKVESPKTPAAKPSTIETPKPAEKPTDAKPPRERPEIQPANPPPPTEQPPAPTKPAPIPERPAQKAPESVKPSTTPEMPIPDTTKPASKPGGERPIPPVEKPVPAKPGRDLLNPSTEQAAKPTPVSPPADVTQPATPTKPFVPPTGRTQRNADPNQAPPLRPRIRVESATSDPVKDQAIRPTPTTPPSDATRKPGSDLHETGSEKKPAPELKRFRETPPGSDATPSGLRPPPSASKPMKDDATSDPETQKVESALRPNNKPATPHPSTPARTANPTPVSPTESEKALPRKQTPSQERPQGVDPRKKQPSAE